MKRKLDELIDLEGLDDATRERLQGVHDQLVAAGPPPELPPALAAAPGANVVPLASRRRRALAGVAVAAAIAAACFGAGVLVGHSSSGEPKTVTVVAMQGEQSSLASVRVGQPDADGNWPIEFTVAGLPRQLQDHSFYILMLEKNGKPVFPCGTFRVRNGSTTVRFTVPYPITKSTQWVVTSMAPGVHYPGPIVMTTV